MAETCYLCGKTCEEVSEYLRQMLTEFQGRSFDGLTYGSFQHCLNSMKSLMYLERKKAQRKERFDNISVTLADYKNETLPGRQAEEKVLRMQFESAKKELAEIDQEIERKQSVVDDFLEVSLEEFQTRNGYIVRLCPVCMGIAKGISSPVKRR